MAAHGWLSSFQHSKSKQALGPIIDGTNSFKHTSKTERKEQTKLCGMYLSTSFPFKKSYCLKQAVCMPIRIQILQEPYSLLKPLLFETYQKYGIPTVNTGPEVGSKESINLILRAAGFTKIKVRF